MTVQLDLHVMELLTSKICHDLISPIGAVNNGVELLEELGADGGDDVTNLISHSATQASSKLQAFRMALGAGGADDSIKPEDVHKIIEAYVSGDGKVKQDWDPYAPLGPEERPKGFCKALMNALLITHDCLPRGGTLSIAGQGETSVQITAAGEGAGFKEGVGEALSGSTAAEDLCPKTIHAHVFAAIASHYGFSLSAQTGDNQVTIEITL